MDFNKLIIERRSCRCFSEGKSIEQTTIENVLADALYSPSWCNFEGYKSYVAFSPEAIKEVVSTLPDFNQKNSKNACAYIVSTYIKGLAGFREGKQSDALGYEWAAYDLGLHDAYMLLSFKDHGYDSLIMGLRDEAKLREIFNIPENEVIMSVIAVGQYDGTIKPVPRKKISEVSYIK